jgi:hypothetical protein
VLHHLIYPINWMTYLPAVTYLAVMVVLVLRKSIWHPVHVIALVPGLGFRAFTEGPIFLGSTALAVLAFFALVWTLSKTISATGVTTLCVTFALLPIAAWWGIAAGLGAALVVAIARTGWRRTRLIGTNTVFALVNVFHSMSEDAADYFPQRPAHNTTRTIMLPPYFLAGVSLAAAVTYLNG